MVDYLTRGVLLEHLRNSQAVVDNCVNYDYTIAIHNTNLDWFSSKLVKRIKVSMSIKTTALGSVSIFTLYVLAKLLISKTWVIRNTFIDSTSVTSDPCYF